MYLENMDKYKASFELFISFPEENDAWKTILNLQFDALGCVKENTTFSVDGVAGWAFFSLKPSVKVGFPEAWKPEVKEYVKKRIIELVTYPFERVYAEENLALNPKLCKGIEIKKDVEVDCQYYYDDISRYL